MRGDPHVSPLHCLEDDEDSGGVSVGRPPTQPYPRAAAQGTWMPGAPTWWDWKGLL